MPTTTVKSQLLAQFQAYGSADNVSEIIQVHRFFCEDGTLEAMVTSREPTHPNGHAESWLFKGKDCGERAMSKALARMGWAAHVVGLDEEG